MIKRLTAFLLSFIIMNMSLMLVQAMYYSDVVSTGWQNDAVNFVADNGYIDSTGVNTYSPNASLTRSVAATMLYRLEGEPNVELTSQFTDVSANASYAKAVSWAFSNGLMNGTSVTTFEPNTGIKRQDLTLVLYKYAALKGYNTDKSADISGLTGYANVSPYALEAMEWAVGTGLISSTGALAPKTVVTRAVGAEFMKKFGIYVEGIVRGRDNFSFDSMDRLYHQTSGTRYISSADYSNLKFYINTYSDEAATDLTAVRELKNQCFDPEFGMAVCVILDKLGKVDINGNFGDTTADTMYELTNQQNDQDLTSAINFYDLTQAISGVLKNEMTIPVVFTTKVFSQLNNLGVALFKYKYVINSNTYECVAVAYNLIQNTDGSYIADLYLPCINDLYDTKLHISASIDNMEVHFDDIGYDTVTAVTLFNAQSTTNVSDAFAVFDKYDIDSYYNNMANTANASNMSIEEESIIQSMPVSKFVVDLNCNFTITNAEGESISYNAGELTGDMEIISSKVIAADTPDNAKMIFTTYESESFSISGADINCELIQLY